MGTLRVTALVVGADDPFDNRVRFGGGYQGWVGILVAGAAPLYAAAKFRLDRDHWLVRGMDAPVAIDPDSPGGFEILWDEIPSIEARVAANDPALADPIGAYKRVLTALLAAGVVGGDSPQPEQQSIGQMMGQALGSALRRHPMPGGPDPFMASLHAHGRLFEGGDTSVVVGDFETSMETIAARSAPPGKVRAGVLFSAHAATSKTSGSDGPSYADRHGKHEVVLSVTVPGRQPYAVHVKKFDHKKGKTGRYMTALPALVSASDPNDVEVQWDELMSIKQARRDGKQMAAEHVAALQERQRAMMQGAGAPPAAGAIDPVAAYRQSARNALAVTTSPATRRMIIEQYRRFGVGITDDGVVEGDA